MVNKLRNNASQSTQGIVFQFLVALEYCLKMNKGDTIYIERFGDITSANNDKGDTQVEVKKRTDNITNFCISIWNTIYNWTQENFDISHYKHLCLVTTQPISPHSVWAKWPNDSFEERLKSLNHLFLNYKRDNIGKELKNKIGFIQDKLSDDLKYQLASKMEIISIKPDLDSWIEKNSPYLNCVPEIQQQNFINELYGYITLESQGTSGWEIGYDAFVQEKQSIIETLVNNTRIFPKVTITEIKEEDYEDKLFVKKIREIQYNEVIQRAIEDYVQTLGYITEIGVSRHKIDEIKNYTNDIKRNHDTMFRRAKRNVSDDTITASQNFYDDYEISPVPPFSNYNNTPSAFRSGLTHTLADENQISWNLGNELK